MEPQLMRTSILQNSTENYLNYLTEKVQVPQLIASTVHGFRVNLVKFRGI